MHARTHARTHRQREREKERERKREREMCEYSLSTSCVRSSKEVVPPYPDALARETRAARYKSFMMAMSEGCGTRQFRTRLDFPPTYCLQTLCQQFMCCAPRQKGIRLCQVYIYTSALLPSLLDWLLRKQRKVGSRGSVLG